MVLTNKPHFNHKTNLSQTTFDTKLINYLVQHAPTRQLCQLLNKNVIPIICQTSKTELKEFGVSQSGESKNRLRRS
jgi:rRNA-processing protein FCF1